MKKLVFFILILFFLILIIPAAQVSDYTSLKAEYIANHPGQAIIPFPWDPITPIKVLPFNYDIPAAPGNTLSLTACRNEFEPASFIINAQKDLSGITIGVSNLYDDQGHRIPSSAVDVRLVKVWYQISQKPYEMDYTTVGYYLTPELLLKDDSLVKVDYSARKNYVKVTEGSVQKYIDISSPTSTFTTAMKVYDAATLQPFSLKANETKQIWITVHVPGTTPTGVYSGNLTIIAQSEDPVAMNLSVTVLPFELEPAPLDYGLYYLNDLNPNAVGITTNDRTAATMAIELQNMKDHGVLYPTFDQHRNDASAIEAYLTLRDTVGFPKDKIYLYGWCDINSCASLTYIGNPTDTAGLNFAATKVAKMRNYTRSHGIRDTYFYGIDEAAGSKFLSQKQAFQMVHNNGGKIYSSGYSNELIQLPDLVDTAVAAYGLSPSYAAQWHSYGNKIYSYGNPQAGVENPEIYRKNYGVALWNARYDGAMNFAYQWASESGDYWNDYDDSTLRDHMFTYPTTNGVIDTIQWEGWREGVDDTRYVASLIKKEGNSISARTIVSAGLFNGENMTMIRKKIITQIQIS
jgi:hypothetical protein